MPHKTEANISDKAIDELLNRAFNEDLSDIGDITCNSVIDVDAELFGRLETREDCIVCGLDIAAAAMRKLDPDCEIEFHKKDGDRCSPGEQLMTVRGKARALLSAERTALNIIQHLSGIATLTNMYVRKIEHTGTKLLDTRKTTPGLRVFEKYATKMGGAVNHRMGLYDTIMIKDNHIVVAGSVQNAIKHAKQAGHTDIQVECDHIEQVKDAIEFGATSVLLDNMSISTLKSALEIAKGKLTCEASGGVTLETIKEIAETGVDYISVGRITQSAPAIDIGLDLQSV